MKAVFLSLFIFLLSILLLTSCSTLERAATHGLNDGFYQMKSDGMNAQEVYLEVTNEQINVHKSVNKQADLKVFQTISLQGIDSLNFTSIIFKKSSLDIDISSILFKYRPSVYGLPAQLSTDLNMALYTGWRKDTYRIMAKKNPLGKLNYKLNSRGYDVGLFAGPGTTLLSPFTTQNKRSDEYNGMIIQVGMAGFLELSMASFGFAIGFDYLPGKDRNIWIYNNKPWLGFVVGIALN